MTLITRRSFTCGLAAGSAFFAKPALAQSVTKVTLGYTATSDFVGAFCAQEEGFFRARGLDVAFQLIPLNSNIPAALQADSVQIGGPTPSVMIQATDGGLDLVAVAGASFTSKNVPNYGFIERAGAGITSAKDAEGKRIGVPGLNAFLHVLFRKWLTEKGADWKKVNFVETPFLQMPDIIRGGSVDGLVTGSPLMERMISANTARLVSLFHTELPEGLPSILYATTRSWAAQNQQLVRAFREGLGEGAAFLKANDAKAREHMGKYIRLPPEVIRTAIISFQKPEITAQELASWVIIMREQDMLRGQINPANLLAP
jgi:NitT/TauT family transport system substrate-binding protein